MKIRIYQINSDRDEHRMMFLSHDRLERFQGSPEHDPFDEGIFFRVMTQVEWLWNYMRLERKDDQ